jgi:hypothetical protein
MVLLSALALRVQSRCSRLLHFGPVCHHQEPDNDNDKCLVDNRMQVNLIPDVFYVQFTQFQKG